MSFNGLMNHTVQVFREPDALASRDFTGNVPSDPQPVTPPPTKFNARPHQRWMGDQRDKGPGEQQDRLRTWFLRKEIDVQENDILLVIAGEEAGLQVRVVSMVPVYARKVLHHKEVNTEAWVGELGD